MMEVREISTQDFKDFAATSTCANYYQSTAFTNMKEKEGWRSFYLGGYEKDILVAATIILQDNLFGKYQYCIAVKGFLIDYANVEHVKAFSHGVKAFLKAHHGLYLRLNPAFFHKEYDEEGTLVEAGYDHSVWKEHLIDAGFRYEGVKRGLDMSEHVHWIYVLPLLNKQVNDIRKGMSKLTQRNIKSAEKYHVEVKEITDKKDLSIFMDIMRETGDRRNFAIFEESYYQDLFDFFMPEKQARFLYAQVDIKAYLQDVTLQLENEAKKIQQHLDNLNTKGENEKTRKKLDMAYADQTLLQKKYRKAQDLQIQKGDVFPISCANFIMYQNEVVYFHGGSYEEYMHFCGQFALQWDMIQYAIEHKYERYNFNGISGIFDKSAPDFGVYTFKKGFGGHVEEYIGYFHCKLNPLVYNVYALLRKLKHLIKK